jgi:hypothetical protein
MGASVYVISSGAFAYRGTTLPSPEIVASLKSPGQVFETYTNDAQCRTSVAKIGRDNDGTSPADATPCASRSRGKGKLLRASTVHRTELRQQMNVRA